MEPSVQRKRPGFYYGWVIVLVSLISDMIAVGMGPATFGVFLRPMSEALGWTRTSITGAVSLQSFANIVVSPAVGWLLDRHGPRAIMVFGAASSGIAFMLLGNIHELWEFYLLYTFASALGIHELGGLVTTTAVAKWFIRHRGRAIAVATLGNSIGGLIVAPLAAFLVDSVGWRSAWGVLGFLIVVVTLPPVIIFMRRSPEDMGLLPDGDSPQETRQSTQTTTQSPSSPVAREYQWSLGEALRTRSVWFMILAFNLSSMAVSAVIYHQVAYFTDIGFSVQAASLVLSLNLTCSLVSKLFWGFLSERVEVRLCLIATFLGRAVGMLVLLLGTAPERVYIFAVLYGLLGGAYGTLIPIAWANYYGRSFLGTIRGALTPFSVFSSLAGPLFAAWAFDTLGSYESAFWVFTATLMLAAVAMFFATPPRQRPSTAPSSEEGTVISPMAPQSTPT